MQDASARKNGSLDLEKSLKGNDGSSYKDSNALKSMKLIVISRRALAWSSDLGLGRGRYRDDRQGNF
jgi:hypothetical protein